MIDVAIVGAGPAGSNCAYNLARRGIHATLFDHSYPREKPCGGMMGVADIEAFSVLKNFPIEHSEVSLMRIISPSQKIWNIDMSKNKLFGFSRMRFDQYILNEALNEGANLIKEKVVGLQKKGESWRVITQKGEYAVKTVVGADGVSSLIRKNIVGSLDQTDMGVCFGYIFKGVKEKNAIIKFLSKIEGFMWVIPRGDNTSIGGGTSKINDLRELKDQVDLFSKTWHSPFEKISEWAALIPNVKNPRTLRLQAAGPDWILIGDAAGHVSPVRGIGIVYALKDGRMAAEAIAQGHVEQFNNMWAESYGKRLVLEARLRGIIYKRPKLESSCIELSCMFMKLNSYISFA